ncbi:MAG: hypothetical protein F6K10_01545 [Moorea sp. SIO2B7]|nr:hypothetical protein [Moorena sp. SIO2B7]
MNNAGWSDSKLNFYLKIAGDLAKTEILHLMLKPRFLAKQQRIQYSFSR